MDSFTNDKRFFVAREALRAVVDFYQPWPITKWPPYAVTAKGALKDLETPPDGSPPA